MTITIQEAETLLSKAKDDIASLEAMITTLRAQKMFPRITMQDQSDAWRLYVNGSCALVIYKNGNIYIAKSDYKRDDGCELGHFEYVLKGGKAD